MLKMPEARVFHWVAYFKLKAENDKKLREKMKAEAKANKGR